MDVDFEQKVREKAYEIWMSAGMADGMAHEHWVTAEQVVANETLMPAKKVKTVAKAVAEAAKKSPKAPAAKKAAAKASNTVKPVKH